MRSASSLILCLIGAAAIGCTRSDVEAALKEREQQVASRMATSATTGRMEPVARWILPNVLTEISGIALTRDGRILAHNDERGRVYVIDPKRGVVTKKFSIGGQPVIADFEAIAVSGNDIFLLESNGTIYQFREGDDNGKVDFTTYDTKLAKECEFEGLEIEPGTGAFLLACKNISKRSERNQLRIYRWTRQAGARSTATAIDIPLADAIGTNEWTRLSPSDLAIDPKTGNLVMVAGREKALVEVTPRGQIVRSFPLPEGLEQPEGVAITRDGLIIIADEGVTGPGTITIYPWRSAPPAAPAQTDSPSTAPASDTSNR